MGQRHQIFLNVPNPILQFPEWELKKNGLKAKLEKQFGTGKNCIVAFHNQWLYGRSALATALQTLNFAAQFSHAQKSSNKGIGGEYNTPITPKGIEANFKTVEKWIGALETVLNFRPVKTPYRGAGFDSNFYIGTEDENINFDFTRGDNNDGITIIDMINNKYCFMNINGKPDKKDRANSASDLPYLRPSNAHAYVAAYYGETVETANEYHIKRGGEMKPAMTPQQVVEQHAKDNAKLVKKLSKFEVLTMDEVKALFPRKYRKAKAVKAPVATPRPRGGKIRL
jgi:hypothetical protein